MNLKYVGILSAFAVSAAMAQTPAAEQAAPAAQAPVAQTAPAPEAAEPAPAAVRMKVTTNDDKMQALEQELAPEALFSEPSAVRGANAEKPVHRTSKKFVYKPVYSPEEIETSGRPVKAIYVAEANHGDTITMDALRGFIPMQFTAGIQGFVGTNMLSGDNGRYEYDRYYGMIWSIGAFALFPLDEYNMGFKTGVFFEHSKSSNSFNDLNGTEYGEWRISFSQYRISLPLLLSLKGAKSSFTFDVGVQPSFAVADKFRMKFSKNSDANRSDDMMKNECRSAIDWSLVLGLSLRANRYVGFDFRVNWGINNMYDDYNAYAINNLSSTSIAVGASFYAF